MFILEKKSLLLLIAVDMNSIEVGSDTLESDSICIFAFMQT